MQSDSITPAELLPHAADLFQFPHGSTVSPLMHTAIGYKLHVEMFHCKCDPEDGRGQPAELVANRETITTNSKTVSASVQLSL